MCSDSVVKPPFTTVQSQITIRWKDIKGLVFQTLDFGNVSDWEAKKLAQKSLLLLGKKQETSKMNLSFYSTMVSALGFLSDDELRRLALQCISKCTNSEDNCENITSIAHKVSVINSRYFDYKYRGKPYLQSKPVSIVDQELANAQLSSGVEDEVDGVFDIAQSLGYIPFSD
jgi:hypothetical protein